MATAATDSGQGIDLKAAAQAASTYLRAAFASEPIQDVRLEEVDRSKDGRFWLITLGFDVPRSPRTAVEAAQEWGAPIAFTYPLPRLMDRVFKVLKVDGRTGEVLSMKIRHF